LAEIASNGQADDNDGVRWAKVKDGDAVARDELHFTCVASDTAHKVSGWHGEEVAGLTGSMVQNGGLANGTVEA
jgi:hypothetical protein